MWVRCHLISFSFAAVLHVCDSFLPKASEHTVGRGLDHILYLSAMSLLHKQEILGSIEPSAPK